MKNTFFNITIVGLLFLALGCSHQSASPVVAHNPAAPNSLYYMPGSDNYTVGTPVPNNVPGAGGGAISSFSISPALPTGLSLNTSTGVISGTPTSASPSTVYTITASNASGSTTARVGLTVFASAPAIYSLPSDRKTLWQSGVTFNGGIPTSWPTYTTLSPNGSDDTNHIQNALDLCPANQVVLLTSGTFTISGDGLTIAKSNVILRGAGANSTKLVKVPRTSYPVIIIGTRWVNFAQPVALASDAYKGATSVTLVSNPGIDVGELLTFDQLTNTAINYWSPTRSPAGDPSRGWFGEMDRPTGQVVEVTAVSGNTISFNTPLHIDFLKAYSARAVRAAEWEDGPIAPPVKWSGIENLLVSGGEGGDGGGNIHLFNAAYSWVKNVESYYQNGTSVNIDRSFRCELRDSYVHGSQESVPGGGAYGIGVNTYAADNLIENNISWDHDKVMVMRTSGGGNVIGYNYMEDGWITYAADFVEVGLNGSHMTTPMYELFEGNQAFNFDGDQTWGGSIYMTVFRNHFTTLRRDLAPVAAYQDAGNRRGIGLEYGHWWYSFVGNVIGYPPSYPGYPAFAPQPAGTQFKYEWLTTQDTWQNVYMWYLGYDSDDWTDLVADAKVTSTVIRDGNFDWLTQEQKWHNSAPATIPNSLYLSSKPDFFGANPWPWVDPATGSLYTLPARERFDAGTPNTLP